MLRLRWRGSASVVESEGVRGLVIRLSRGSEPVRARCCLFGKRIVRRGGVPVLRAPAPTPHPHSWAFAAATTSLRTEPPIPARRVIGYAPAPGPSNDENLALSERSPLGIVKPLGVVGMFPLAPHGAAE
jgi:hypothetical protein